ncbi:extracellular solute-binding protein [Micrococcales bacterium 31B]|nr:extracellular solute-binding protein [Micrococcales bacterium 31B]
MHLSRASFLRLSGGALGAMAMPALASCTEPAAVVKGELRVAWWGAEVRAQVTQLVIEAYGRLGTGFALTGESVGWGDYPATLEAAIEASELPDVLQLNADLVADLSARGLLADLGEQGGVLNLSDLEGGPLERVRMNGRQVSVPSGVDAQGILINVKVLRDAGVEVPRGDAWTWSEYRELARRVQQGSPAGTYGAAAQGYAEPWAVQRDGGLYGANGDKVSQSTVQSVFEFQRGLIAAQAAPPWPEALADATAAPAQRLFAQGRLGMQPGWSADLFTYAALGGLEMAMVPPPRQDEGGGSSGVYLKSTMQWAVSARSENPQAAAAFVSYLVNSTEAPALQKTDRGVPSNVKVRDAIRATFTGIDLARLNYVDRVAGDSVPEPPVPPGGTALTLQRLETAFATLQGEGMTVAAAAEQAVAELGG